MPVWLCECLLGLILLTQPSNDSKKPSDGAQDAPISISLKGKEFLKEDILSMSASLYCQQITEGDLILAFSPNSKTPPQFTFLSTSPNLDAIPLIFDRAASDVKPFFKGYRDLKARAQGLVSQRSKLDEELSRELKKSWTATNTNIFSKENLKDSIVAVSYDGKSFQRFMLRKRGITIESFTEAECSFVCDFSLISAGEGGVTIPEIPPEVRTRRELVDKVRGIVKPLIIASWNGPATAAALSPDETLVAIGLTGERTAVRLYSLPKLELHSEFDLGPGKLTTTALTFDDVTTHVVAAYGSHLHFLNITNKESSYVLSPQADAGAGAVADSFDRIFFVPGNGILAVRSGNAILIPKAMQGDSGATLLKIRDPQLYSYFDFATDWGTRLVKDAGGGTGRQIADRRNKLTAVTVDKRFRVTGVEIQTVDPQVGSGTGSETLLIRRERYLGKPMEILAVPRTRGALLFPEGRLVVDSAQLPIRFIPHSEWSMSDRMDQAARDAGQSVEPPPYIPMYFNDEAFGKEFRRVRGAPTVQRKQFEDLLREGKPVVHLGERFVLSVDGASFWADTFVPGVFEKWNLPSLTKDVESPLHLSEPMRLSNGLAFVRNHSLLASSIESSSGFPVLSFLDLQTRKVSRAYVLESGELYTGKRGRSLLLLDKPHGCIRVYDLEGLEQRLVGEQ